MNERFHKAQDRLYEELDLLKLVQQLRFASLLAKAKLKKRHWGMIGDFNRYCIKDQDDSSSSDENHQSTTFEQVQQLSINNDDDPQIYYNNKYDQIYYFGKPKQQKKFLDALSQYKFSRAQFKAVQNWILQVGDLMKLQQMTKDFQPGHIQDKPLDMAALRELSGVKRIDEDIIWKTNQEVNEEIDIIWQKVKEFADSKEGEMCIQRLMPDFGLYKRENKKNMAENWNLDLQPE